MSQLIDISPLISNVTAVWPGDVAMSRSVALDMSRGDNLTLSSVTTTLHIGAHADAPSHYGVNGKTIDERSLDLYYGPCQVVSCSTPAGSRIAISDLASDISSERVLLRTMSASDPTHFNTDFVALSVELVEFLHSKSVRLIGIDTPSVDLFHDEKLDAHCSILHADMAILEGLVLSDVADGHYTLLALPLKISGADASPVRAALLPR